MHHTHTVQYASMRAKPKLLPQVLKRIVFYETKRNGPNLFESDLTNVTSAQIFAIPFALSVDLNKDCL